MDTFQPPPPFLPDLLAPPMLVSQVPQLQDTTPMTGTTILLTPTASQRLVDSPMQIQQHPQQTAQPPPPPSLPQHAPPPLPPHMQPQLPDMAPSEVVEELVNIMSNETDKVVLTNSVCLLFRFSIDSVRGPGVCQYMSTSPAIMNRLYYVLMDPEFNNDDLILCYATGNLTSISKYEEGRAALVGWNSTSDAMESHHYHFCSPGIDSLLRALRSRDINVLIFAITAIHNLLLDRRAELQRYSKEQLQQGIEPIVQLLNNTSLMHNYEFKVIVLDCLQILAYGNKENRLSIKKSGGPLLLLKTIKDNLDQQTPDELIETATRVLKSLSACPENKIDIIEHGGIIILTQVIEKTTGFEILKTCLWTLRNLSDIITKCPNLPVDHLVLKLLHILEHMDIPALITCALGILANLTCNNQPIKQLICESGGVDLLINCISVALKNGCDREILEPAVGTLCHLMNQTNEVLAADAKRRVRANNHIFDIFMQEAAAQNAWYVKLF